ncbi:hypothetical protein [Variovorax sp. JS1663]|uniref:hypothetical protein n=1 Tax=Variovorax sp. JS1663 TaxID=1851577 RepID=UPI00117E3A9D|nr:hypothetical protein [Variovorax sp. JS1663]
MDRISQMHWFSAQHFGLELDPTRSRPIVHLVFAGELKHHLIRKDGSLRRRKTALPKSSPHQRLGFQLLVEESGGAAFADLYLVGQGEGKPRLDLAPFFLAFAWMAPTMSAEPAPQTGLPDILVVPRDLLTEREVTMRSMARELGFAIHCPADGFVAHIHHATYVGIALDNVLRDPHNQGIDWTQGSNLGLLSSLVAYHVTRHAAQSDALRARQRLDRRSPAVRREVPSHWLERVGKQYRECRLNPMSCATDPAATSQAAADRADLPPCQDPLRRRIASA